MNEKRLKQLQELLNSFEQTVSSEVTLKDFEQLANIVANSFDVQNTKIDRAIKNLAGEFDKLTNVVSRETERSVAGVEAKYDKELKEVKKAVSGAILELKTAINDLPDVKDGYTPVKGEDYFTPKEIKEIKDDIIEEIPTVEEIIDEIEKEGIDYSAIKNAPDWNGEIKRAIGVAIPRDFSGGGETGKGSVYTHTQNAPSATWIVSHNLNNTAPVITVWDSYGLTVEPEEIEATDENNIQITFGEPISGKATVVSSGVFTESSGGCCVETVNNISPDENKNIQLTTDNIAEGDTNEYYTDAKADARITAQKGVNNGLATLGSDGKIPLEQLQQVIVNTVTSVADIDARDALTPTANDFVIVADATDDPNVLSGGASYIYDGVGEVWLRVLTPDGTVATVNGQTGTVTLTTDEITEGSTNKYFTGVDTTSSITGDGDATPLSVQAIDNGNYVIRVKARTTANLTTYTYDNGTAGVGATLTRTTNGGFPNIDGVVINEGDVILLGNQSSQITNGVYTLTQKGVTGVSPAILTRHPMADTTEKLEQQIVIVANGSVNIGNIFRQSTASPVIGTNNIVYTDTSSSVIRQINSGSQAIHQIPTYGSALRQMYRGTANFKYNRDTDVFTIKGVDYSFPASNSVGFLSNDGSGNLTFQTVDLSSKQDVLVSGTNIKTVNSTSLLGSGNIDIPVEWGAITGTLSDQTDLQDALDLKADISSLATVATSGAYADISGTPSLATVATSGAYSDLSGTPTLATVATTGDYDDLTDKPDLSNFISQASAGTQVAGQIPIYTGTGKELSKGSSDFKYYDVDFYYGVAIGKDVGIIYDGSTYSNNDGIFIGRQAGSGILAANNVIAIGFQAGKDADSNATNSNFIGYQAGYLGYNANNNNFIGYQAGYDASAFSSFATKFSNFIGVSAGYQAKIATNSNFIGNEAGYQATNAANSVFIGNEAGKNDTVDNTSGGSSIAIGYQAGTGGFSDSIALGSGAVNTKANELMLGSVAVPIDSLVLTGERTPSSSTDTGTKGTICYDEDYLYICIDTDTWTRVALAW
jgi:hypothetical protein